MKIRDHPFFTKPSFKLKEKGAYTLDTAELLAILFWVGSEEESSIDLANRLLKKYNLSGLVKCTLKELTDECNSEAQACKILSLFELVKRYNKLMSMGFRSHSITSAEDVFNMFKDDFQNLTQEEFHVVLLDAKNRVIRTHVSTGTLTSSIVHPRDVFKEAIRDSAKSIMLVHNHPSGDPTPSKQDLEITEDLIHAGDVLGIPVLDHIIVGKSEYWSWKDAN